MSELTHWLRLWHIPKIGPRTFSFLLSKFPEISEIFELSSKALVDHGVPAHIAHAITCENSNTHINDLSWLNSNSNHSITLLKHQHYPKALKQIHDPPPILYGIGDTDLMSAPLHIAIVGSRASSTFARNITRQIANELASYGVIIVSGLARGIDKHAHIGALDSNSNSTIAVLANGLDIVYPSEHRDLAQKISNGGLLISEFAPRVKPLPQHFPRRNRIISGLCLGTLVIEAANKSGSLITARYALEQGREIFAVPGPINDTNNEGCHKLIQQGAKLTTCVEDILSELAPMLELDTNCASKICTNNNHINDADLLSLLNSIEFIPTTIDKIIEKSGLTPERVSSMLTELELGGHVVTNAIGQYSRL